MTYNFKLGDKVTYSGFSGTIIETKDSEGCAWMGTLVTVRLDRGTVCVGASEVTSAEG